MYLKYFFLFGLSLLVGVAGIGCSSGLIKPKGKVVKNGAPIQVDPNERLEVAFYPVSNQGDSADVFQGGTSPDGSFVVVGRKGKGIPPGKYRITVEHLKGFNQRDILNGAFSPTNSLLIREVLDDREEIIIDVGKPSR